MTRFWYPRNWHYVLRAVRHPVLFWRARAAWMEWRIHFRQHVSASDAVYRCGQHRTLWRATSLANARFLGLDQLATHLQEEQA